MPLSLQPQWDETIWGLSASIRARRVSCCEVWKRGLAAFDRDEPNVRAWVAFGGESVEQLVAERDAELKQGSWRGPLHGILIGVKDIYDIVGQPTRAGIPNFEESPATRNSAMVNRLRKAGAVIVGKTVTTPYAFFDPPPTRNPWNLVRTPGGSSSGSAAAVASGMCLGALGSQTGGSITRPASFCGIAGYKPTFGWLNRRGVFPFAPSLDHPGPMARTVDDLICMMTALAPARMRSNYRALLNTPSEEGIERVEHFSGGYSISNVLNLTHLDVGFAEKTDAAMSMALDQAIMKLAGRGACAGHTYSDDLELPRLWRCHRTIMAVEIAVSQAERLRQHPEQFPPGIRGLIEEGLAASAFDYAEALQFQRDLRCRARKSIGSEIWIMPAARGAAPTPETTGDPCMNSPWSFLGFPTITFPMALSPDGLPLGIQLIAGPGCDLELFRAARWCEAALRQP